MAWSTAEAANQVQGRQGFNFYVIDVTLKLVKASRAEEGRIYKPASRLNSCINIGR
jgi:hypothetical protein